MYNGEKAFKLYDTFGCRSTSWWMRRATRASCSTRPASRERWTEQRSTARASWKGGAQGDGFAGLCALPARPFSRATADGVAGLRGAGHHGQGPPRARNSRPESNGRDCARPHAVLCRGGGQAGDRGLLYIGDTVVGEVGSVHSPVQGVRAHQTRRSRPSWWAIVVNAVVDSDLRRATMRHHTGTHLLHAALRSVLGST
jgi:alanyl-tRNA synthetase